MKLSSLIVVALLVAFAAGIAGAAGIGPAPISLSISIDSKPKAAENGGPTVSKLTLKLDRLVETPVSGRVLLRYPAFIDPTGQMTKNLEFDLSKSKSATLTEKLTIPAGTPDGQYVFQVEAYAGGKKILAADPSVTIGSPTEEPRRREARPSINLRLADVTRDSVSITWETPAPTASRITVQPAAGPGGSSVSISLGYSNASPITSQIAKQRRALPVYGDTPKSAMVKPQTGSTPMVFEDKTNTAVHGFTVDGLKPGTRYLVSVSPAADGKESEPLSFYTAPPAGKTMYIRLKVVNVIFTNVTNKPDADREGAKTPASQVEVDRIKRELQLASMYYWINTGMRIWMDNEVYVTDKYYEVDNTPYGVGYTGVEEPALKEILEANGKKVSDYDDRNFISLEKRWDPAKNAWTLPSSGGGTYGPEREPGYGVSAWKAGGQNYWLFVHEDGHQVDALYGWSGEPEYLFNHFQPWDDTAHRHGEHFDGNTWLLREWAGYYTREHQGGPMLEPSTWFRYFANRWGQVEFAADKDEDGIPDNAPDVPIDESRWNSDPAKKDTDGDGLTDMQEAMACQWVDYGLSEVWAGSVASHRCDPRIADTDGDGIPDGKDPYPIYPARPQVGTVQPRLDGVVTSGEYALFAALDDPAYKAELYLGWDDNNLYVAMKSETAPESAKMYIDFGDNGWFVGKDNYDLRITPAGTAKGGGAWHVNAEKTLSAALHNCGEPGKWPFYDPEGLKDGEVRFAQTTDKGYSFEIAIPKNKVNGVDLVKGKKIGILFAAGPAGGNGRAQEPGQLTVFEPHTFYAFELTKR